MSMKPEGGTQTAPKEYSMGLLNLAVVLWAISAILHLYIGSVIIGGILGIPLILIAAVYLGGIVLIEANYRRDLWLKIAPGWVALLIVLWIPSALVNATGTRDPF